MNRITYRNGYRINGKPATKNDVVIELLEREIELLLKEVM